MLNIVLFGPPGAGKGTQSQKLIEKYKLKHISTGDIFRWHLSQGTELGQKAQKYMDDGKLVPDAVVIGMVGETIQEHKDGDGFILDGFPRTVAQARALDELMKKFNMKIDGMVALQVPEEELKRRIKERGKTSGRTDDQNEEKVNTRIRVYKEETMPVANYYEKQGKFAQVDGVGSIDEIFNNICDKVENF
jgi:adenylate kinase